METAVLWDQGRLIMLDSTWGWWSQGININDRGQVIGREYRWDKEERSHKHKVMLWDAGQRIELEGTGVSSNYSGPIAINNAEQIVGVVNRSWHPKFRTSTAVMWQERRQVPLFPPRAIEEPVNSEALGINNHGAIVGNCRLVNGSLAVQWFNGNCREVELSDWNFDCGSAYAHDINDHGQIVGWAWSKSLVDRRYFLWRDEFVTDLGAVHPEWNPPLDGAWLRINNLGQIVGFWLAESHEGPLPGEGTWLWDDGRFVMLSSPIGRGCDAYDINDLGQVVGEYEGTDGVWRACMWER